MSILMNSNNRVCWGDNEVSRGKGCNCQRLSGADWCWCWCWCWCWADGQSEPQSANTEHEAAGSRTNGATLIRRKLPFGNGTFYEWIGPETRYRYVLVMYHVENIIFLSTV